MKHLLLLLLVLPSVVLSDEIAPLKAALQKQAKHKSVEVTFRQTKKSPALADEIKTMGKLWLLPGKAFRWEMDQPARQTVIYNGDDVLVLDEKKKTGKRLSPDDKQVKPLFLTLGMGNDASFDGLSKAFHIAGTDQKNGRFAASFTPKVRSIKKMIKSLLMQVNLETSFIQRIGWVQRDGTEAMTEFFEPTINKGIPAQRFVIDEKAYTWE